MGKFDGYLICSDFDGTFSAGEDTVEVNSDAIKYFINNGGKFTFTTGRLISHFREPVLSGIINAPVGAYNGAIIYDFEKKSVIFEKCLDYNVGEFIEAIRDGLHYEGTMYVYYDCLAEKSKIISFECVDEVSKDIRNVKPLKIICTFPSRDMADDFKAFAKDNNFFCDSAITKSWSVGVEFNSICATKGKSIEFIKEYLGNIHTSIGVGDYENDISLIKSADIGVAVGDAVDEVISVADMVIKPASEYAIKDLIEKIEEKL